MTAAPPSANTRLLYIVSSHHGRSGNRETWQHAGQVSGAGVRVYTETLTFSSEDLLSGLIMISSYWQLIRPFANSVSFQTQLRS